MTTLADITPPTSADMTAHPWASFAPYLNSKAFRMAPDVYHDLLHTMSDVWAKFLTKKKKERVATVFAKESIAYFALLQMGGHLLWP